MNREEYFKIIENVNHITLENALKIINEYCILKDKKESDIDKLIIFLSQNPETIHLFLDDSIKYLNYHFSINKINSKEGNFIKYYKN